MTGLAAAAALSTLPTGEAFAARPAYRGPNVIIIRFGGGVRRLETIHPEHGFAPFLRHRLAPRGVLFPDMRIADGKDIVTSHGEGTLYTLTGRYEKYLDKSGETFGNQFEASVPTLFEYLRKAYAVAPHEALLVNGEDRRDEEFFTFGNHRNFGIRYRSEVLSLYRFKTYLLRRKIAAREGTDKELAAIAKKLTELEAFDYRRIDARGQTRTIERFWSRWRTHYGDSGLKNPRGDRLLTELAVRAIRELAPKLLMVNYQDPDYVHWGNASHYTRSIAIIDQGIVRLVETVAATPGFRGNTVFVVLPDCGRDTNPLLRLPYQHHFNSRSAHEIWALIAGPGIAKGAVVDKTVDQTQIAATVGRIMGFPTPHAESRLLQDAFA